MAWLPRRRPRREPDPALPMFLDGDRAARFVALAREVFAEHGLECSYDEGSLRAEDGRRFGLTNVALVAASSPIREWRGLLVLHVEGLAAAYAAPRLRDLDVVRDRIYLRLWAPEDLPLKPDRAESLGEGLVGLAAIDHPEHVETIAGAEDLAQLGGWPAIREAALANLGRLRADDVITLGEDTPTEAVQLSVGGFFNASRVFTMTRLLREDFLLECPRHGVLFAVPNRHVVAVHPLHGPGMVPAVGRLIRVAMREYEVPGAISPHVWFWHDGQVQQATKRAADGAVELHVHGPLQAAMTELGLIEEG